MLPSGEPVLLTATPASQRDVLESTFAQAVPERVGHGVFGDIKIEPPVAVEIGENGGHTPALGTVNPGAVRDVLERAVMAVPPEPVRLALEHPRPRKHLDPAGVVVQRRRVDRVHDQVIHHVQVEPAVAIDVTPGGRDPPLVLDQAGRGGDVAECAVPLVLPERVRAVLSHEQIEVAIGVVVGHGHALRPAGPAQARIGRHVAPAARSVVAEQPRPASTGDAIPLHLAPASDEDVQVTVAVDVEQRSSRAERVQDRGLVRAPADRDHVHPEVMSPIDEPGAGLGLGTASGTFPPGRRLRLRRRQSVRAHTGRDRRCILDAVGPHSPTAGHRRQEDLSDQHW